MPSIFGSRKDMLTPSYTIFSILVFLFGWLSGDLDRVFRVKFMFLPIVAFFMLMTIVLLTFRFLISISRFYWRQLISIIISPFAVLILRSALIHFHVTPELLQFDIYKSFYEKESLKIASPDGLPHIKVWDWGETGGLGTPNIIYILVYDDSDQIALAYFNRSSEWRIAAESAAKGNAFYSIIHPESYSTNVTLYISNITIAHLDGHFYLVSELL